MPEDELIEKMARAAEPAAHGPSWELAKEAQRRALTAVREAGCEVVRVKAEPDWYWRQIDPDDAGDSINEALRFVGEGVVCHLGSSYVGPSFFAAMVPVLDLESDDTEEITADTEDECVRLVKERYAALKALSSNQENNHE